MKKRIAIKMIVVFFACVVFLLSHSDVYASGIKLNGDDEWDDATNTLTVNTNPAKNAYTNNEQIEHVIIGESVTEIGIDSFSGCNNLESFQVVPENECFRSASGVLFSYDKTTIVRFPQAKQQKIYVIPDYVTEIIMGAFRGCDKIQIITCSEDASLRAIGPQAFADCCQLTTIQLPSSIEGVGIWAFRNCSSLMEIEVNEGGEYYYSIDGVLFNVRNGYHWLVIFPEGKETDCYTVPESVYGIDYLSCSYCKGLKKVIFNSNLARIGNSSFWGCDKLEEVDFSRCNYEMGLEIQFGAFGRTRISKLVLPACVKSVDNGSAFYKMNNLHNISVDSDNNYLTAIDGVLYDKRVQKLYFYPLQKEGSEYVVPETVSSFGNSVFDEEEQFQIKKIVMNGSMETIKRNSFPMYRLLDLREVVLAGQYGTIKDEAFKGCKKLERIIITGNVSVVSQYAFNGINNGAVEVFEVLINQQVPPTIEGDGKYVYSDRVTNHSFVLYVPQDARDAYSGAKWGASEVQGYMEIRGFHTVGIIDGLNCSGDVLHNSDSVVFVKRGGTVSFSSETGIIRYIETDAGMIEGTGILGLSSNLIIKGVSYDTVGESLCGHSLSLDGNIGINYYFELDETILKDTDAFVRFELPDGSSNDVYVTPKGDRSVAVVDSKTVEGKTLYVFQCKVAAKEMTDKVYAQMYLSGGNIGAKYEYDVKEYADYMRERLDNPEYRKAYGLVCSMLNYGTYSQVYFGNNVESPANADSKATEQINEIDSIDAQSINRPYNSSTENLPENVRFVGSDLELESETTLNLYFEKPNDIQIMFMCDECELEQKQVGDYTQVKVSGIKVQDLGKDVAVTLNVNGNSTDYMVKYSPMNYCYNVLSRETTEIRTESLKDLIRALYVYNQAAVQYFGGE